MLEQLLPYYEKELGYLRALSGEFAARYPKIAQRLALEGDQCDDPHVERLIEAFAFLSARIHRRLDDEFPEISEAFLQTLYPHYVQPIPSITILSMEMDTARPALTASHTIPRHQTVMTPPVNGVQCRFRTAYDVELLPLVLQQAGLTLTQASPWLRSQAQAFAALTLDFSTTGALPIAGLAPDRLRFFIDAEPQLAHFIHELVLSKCLRIDVLDTGDNAPAIGSLPSSVIRAVGFERDESLLDYSPRTLPGYRLLTEYFAYPEKFLFFEVNGLRELIGKLPGQTLRLRFWLDSVRESQRYQRFLAEIDTANFRLFCTPAINLFRQGADPVRVSHLADAYPVVPDARRPLAYEVIAVDSVVQIDKTGRSDTTRQVPPLYSTDHRTAFDRQTLYWYATREPSPREGDKGTDVFLALSDLDFSDVRPDSETLSVVCTCSNRDGPESLPYGGNAPHYEIPGQSLVRSVRPLRKPTRAMRPPQKSGLQWRLISHLSLNILSLVADGRNALQELLLLYNVGDDPANARQIRALRDIASRPALARLGGYLQQAHVRGTRIDLTIDEDEFVGTGAFLFCSILERFFGLYTAANSFTELHVHTVQRGADVFRWPARSGDTPLV
jgi:type VI secretion system protein ImpG